jgi:hypothetical protein
MTRIAPARQVWFFASEGLEEIEPQRTRRNAEDYVGRPFSLEDGHCCDVEVREMMVEKAVHPTFITPDPHHHSPATANLH